MNEWEKIQSIKLFKYHKSGNKIMSHTHTLRERYIQNWIWSKTFPFSSISFRFFLNEYIIKLLSSHIALAHKALFHVTERHGKKCHSKQTAKILLVCVCVCLGIIWQQAALISHTVVFLTFSSYSHIVIAIAFKAAILGDMKMMMMMSYRVL